MCAYMCIVRKAAPHKCHGLQGPVQSPPSTPKSSSMYVERALTQWSKCTTRAPQVFTICWVWTLQWPPLPDGGAGECWGGGTSTGEDGNRTGHKSPPWEAWTRPASLSWVRVIHSEKEGRHTGPRSRRYRKAIGSQSTCKGSKTQRLTQPQGTRFYSDFSQALPGEPEHFSHSTLMTEDLRHTSVSRDQQDLSSPNSGPKDDVQQLPPSWCFWFFQTKASQYLGSPLLGELSWPEHLTSCDPARYPWGQTFPQLRPTEGNWGQISSMHMRNIQLGFSALFLTSPNILRKPSNMKERIQTKWVTKNRNNDQKWT